MDETLIESLLSIFSFEKKSMTRSAIKKNNHLINFLRKIGYEDVEIIKKITEPGIYLLFKDEKWHYAIHKQDSIYEFDGREVELSELESYKNILLVKRS